MTANAYKRIIAAPARDRLDLFLTSAYRLGTTVGNVEKDFWICWTLDVLYNRRPLHAPRLLFKGGTSLSKAYGLIQRFSEDIDVSVFRDDLAEPASVDELQMLSGKQRRAKLLKIRDACRAYVTGPLKQTLAAELAEGAGDSGHIEIDPDDPDRQTLLVWYPKVEPHDGAYVRPAVRIESGAKSALDPHQHVLVRPYVTDDISELALDVPNVTTIEAHRTFWDKIVIIHGLRRWYERRGTLRQEGQRISRHYYDLHCLLDSPTGHAALSNLELASDCVRHARTFFDRTDFDLASAKPGSFAIAPTEGMVNTLRHDYENTMPMIFGTPPAFDEVLTSIHLLDSKINRTAVPSPVPATTAI